MRQFYRDWNLAYGEPNGIPYTSDEAEQRFVAGVPITLIVGDVDTPTIVLQIMLAGRLVKVTWLDRLRRPELHYVYAVREEPWPQNKLLLERVRITRYQHEEQPPDADPSYIEEYVFQPDGTFWGSRGSAEGIEREETRGQLDHEQLRRQVEAIPSFGSWQALLRRDR